MRNLLLALSLSLVLPLAARAAAPVAPETFVGDYQLVQARVGLLCDSTMQSFLIHSLNPNDTKYVEIDLGPWVFTSVNAGPQNFEDTVSKSVTNSYTTADSELVFESKDVSKADGEVSRSMTVAHLDGNILHVVSHGSFAHPSGGSGETESDCVFQKVDSGN